MNDPDKKIECDIHGVSIGTFTCQHLVKGEKLGFNLGLDPNNIDELYPDAWCNKCEKVLDAEGGWNDYATKFAGIKCLCSFCYEEARERNWLQDNKIFHDLVCSSHDYLSEKQKILLNKYKINDYERWDINSKEGTLIFSHEGQQKVKVNIQISGTFSKKSNTWMWSWANNSLDENIKSPSRNIRELGEELSLLKLVTGHWAGTEVDGWEMTSICAKKLNAIGAYRTLSEDIYIYMTISKAEWLT